MSDEEFIISLVGIVFGTGFVSFLFWNFFSLAKTWINRKSGSGTGQSQINPQFFKALGDFKKSTERRITNLETIVADLEEEQIRIPDAQGEIEIESEDVRSPKKDKEDDDSNLRNMLNE